MQCGTDKCMRPQRHIQQNLIKCLLLSPHEMFNAHTLCCTVPLTPAHVLFAPAACGTPHAPARAWPWPPEWPSCAPPAGRHKHHVSSCSAMHAHHCIAGSIGGNPSHGVQLQICIVHCRERDSPLDTLRCMHHVMRCFTCVSSALRRCVTSSAFSAASVMAGSTLQRFTCSGSTATPIDPRL